MILLKMQEITKTKVVEFTNNKWRGKYLCAIVSFLPYISYAYWLLIFFIVAMRRRLTIEVIYKIISSKGGLYVGGSAPFSDNLVKSIEVMVRYITLHLNSGRSADARTTYNNVHINSDR